MGGILRYYILFKEIIQLPSSLCPVATGVLEVLLLSHVLSRHCRSVSASCVWRGEDSDMCGPSQGVVVKTTRRGEQLIAVLVLKADATSFSLIDLLLEMQWADWNSSLQDFLRDVF